MKKAGILAVLLAAAGVVCTFATYGHTAGTHPANTSAGKTASSAPAEEKGAAMKGSYQTKELWFQRGALKIYGQALIPGDGSGHWPTVIIAHGFSGSYRDNLESAKILVQNGFAVYVFDFCGGSNSSKSDGSTTEMSVLTEVSDLPAVLAGIGTADFADPDHIFLMGESQGGFVAALTAAQARNRVKGLVLLYPALMIPDAVKSRFPDRNAIPDTADLWGVSVGRNYFADVWDLDVYGQISQYSGPVLIFHGTKDDLVPPSYSQRAVDAYANARLVMVQGGGHGFYGREVQDVGAQIVDFLMNLTQ
jgi:pimeloyl-ACP methyl ester carboxylesterase